jgi:hypothetical protein
MTDSITKRFSSSSQMMNMRSSSSTLTKTVDPPKQKISSKLERITFFGPKFGDNIHSDNFVRKSSLKILLLLPVGKTGTFGHGFRAMLKKVLRVIFFSLLVLKDYPGHVYFWTLHHYNTLIYFKSLHKLKIFTALMQ